MRILAYIGVAVLACSSVSAQPREGMPKFETVEIHASGPNTIPRMRSGFSQGRYELTNATVADLISTAWDVEADNVKGGPAWLNTDRFDVVATAPPSSTPEMLRKMLTGLLEERMGLVAHRDKSSTAVYGITVGKKLQLKRSAGSGEARCGVSRPGNPISFECRNMTMASFANELPRMPGESAYLFNYRVVDQTGLQGAWDFSVKWSMPNPAAPRQAAGNNITLFDAFENQLGLKLVRAKISTPAVVIDSVRKPAVDLTDQPPAQPMKFEVASIKPGGPDTRGGNVAIERGGGVRMTVTLKDLIWEAWGNLNTDRIVGGPRFMETTIWVVEAKAPARDDSPAGWTGPVWNQVDLNSTPCA